MPLLLPYVDTFLLLVLELEEFGKSLFIDGEIQVAATDEHLYSSTFVGAGLNLNKNKSYFGEGFNMMVTKDYKEMIILSPDEYIEHKNTIYEVNKLGEIKGGIINNENAYIYLVKKKNN